MAGALFPINCRPLNHSFPKISNPTRPLLCHRPMASNLQQAKYWIDLTDEIDAHLKQTIPMRPPLLVYEPMHHLTFSAPRTTAPALCIAACELVGGHREQALPAASALRIMHAAAFTHERLPALADRADIVHSYGLNVELLTPDGMVPFGMELLVEADDPARETSGRTLRVIAEIARAMGSQGMVQGQYKERQHDATEGSVGDAVRAERIMEVCKKKEGELHACAGACGAILGGGSEEEIEKLRRYGLHVGTIQGIVEREGKKGLMEDLLKELRNLAMKELTGFDQGKVKDISTMIYTELCYV